MPTKYFKQGSLVKVIERVEPDNWGCAWDTEMDDFIGNIYSIQYSFHIDNEYILCNDKGYLYSFPREALESCEQMQPIEEICIKIRQMERRRKEKGYAF
jgi:hypothetical protein